MKISILFLLLCFMQPCFSQDSFFRIQKENNHFYVGNRLIENFNYVITNEGVSPVWVWFSKKDLSLLSDSLKVRQYFKNRPPKSDGNFYQWMCDGNVANFTPYLFLSFLKVIPSKGKFYISFIVQDSAMMDSTIDAHINIVSEKEIVKQCPGIDSEQVKKQFSYNSSFIAIPWNYFKKEGFR